MPAKTKKELLALADKEFDKLQRLLDDMPAMLRLEKDADETSPKDIVGHRAHWIQLFLGWYHDGRDGKEVFFPAKGYKWNELKRYNAELRQKQSSLSWPSARSLLETGHAELLALLESLEDEDLYAGPMKGANNDWTAGRWAEAAGPSHYRSAVKYLRQRIRTFQAERPENAA
ncbi:ClbS/DfsB family four-helix bundle protein [Roseibium sediminicola]|uniref:ClbS/DfsB family four-helix bundle protein n=1 Tax=Roseibium sediminicola TaxID=2933272 RepID=A0ABT0GNB0_9HYPH|nr:ClbS/DfsB family four-helix bundle protein [Roseibium sp. CAU 1639]MCK7610910.1 ClbS/DfsB family four-helix bundle protein [Roseibium sp. CAU 1639]